MIFKPLMTIGLLAIATASHAAFTIGGITFSDRSSADQLVSSVGDYTVNGPSLAAALTDNDLSTWATSMTPGAYVVLRFTDNSVVNGVGDDLALFEVGHEAYEYSQEGFDSFDITINGITRTYFTTETTTIVDDHNVNMTTLDLSFFGVAEGGAINEIKIGMDFDTRGSRPQLQLVAAIHDGPALPVPEPQTWMLLASGLSLLAAYARRKVGGGR